MLKLKSKFFDSLAEIIYGMLSMSKGVIQYGVETTGLMDLTEEISEIMDIPTDTVLDPKDDDIEFSIQKLREEIEDDAHECAVKINDIIEKRIKAYNIGSKEEVAECLKSLSEESLENLYISVCGGLELKSQKEGSDYVGIAILYYIQGDTEKLDSIIDAFSE
jgi:hypothetical protein